MLLYTHCVLGWILTTLAQLTVAFPATVCESLAFANTPVIAMGRTPMSIKALALGSYVCFQVTLTDTSAQYVSIAISPTPKMVNEPANNAVIYDVTDPPAMLYTMSGYDHRDTRVNSDQSVINVTQSTNVNGVIQFTFQRKLAAVVASDVAIDPNDVTIITWAYGTKGFPSTHEYCGALELTLNSAANSDSPLTTIYTAYIAAGVFALMLILGLIATHFGRFRLINHTTLCAPPKSDKGLNYVVQIAADLKVGEVIIVLLFVGALIGAALYLMTPTPILNYSMFSFISGHLALVSLMFALLPIARGPHWHFLFGISHDRILKFHRGCSRVFVIFGILHLILNFQFTSPASKQIYGLTQVNPLAGTAALVYSTSLIAVSYEPIRRKFYSKFYIHHRIFSLLAFLTTMVHSAVARYAMIVPLIIYGLSCILRLRAFCQRYDANVDVGEESIVVLTLPSTKQTSQWAKSMNPSSYFYLQIPTISSVEWHPFSAVVTPRGDTIAFYLKTMGKGKFVDNLYNEAKTRTSHGRATIPIAIGGPYGKLSVDILQYQVVILVAGGIGITPMLSLVNQFRNKRGKAGGVFHLYWTVREVNALLMADKDMYPLPESLVHKFYVTSAATEGQVMTSSGSHQHYYAKRPVWDELINPVAFVGKSVCVLTCGPGQLTRDIQRVARQCSYDFHKEEFEF